ncbi:sensor histidine kinase [Thermodesulfobacteriota bacterium]
MRGGQKEKKHRGTGVGSSRPEGPAQDTIRPFELVKYFTFTSLILIFAGTLTLSFIIAQRTKRVVLKKSEDYALLVANNLNHQVVTQVLIRLMVTYGRIELRKEEQYELMDEVVRATVHGFNVDLVNIYDEKNVISYSFDSRLLGMENAGGKEYKEAFTQGISTSRLEKKGPLWAILVGIPEESKLRTWVPLRQQRSSDFHQGRVVGVFEIVQDLSDDFRTIFGFRILIIAVSAGVMGVLFVILRLVVKRGEALLLERAAERLRLEEQLSQKERLASLGELAAAVSHEIRNPLGIIRSSAELLKKRSATNGQASGLADVIVEESTRLNDIITDFLSFARPQAPKLSACRVEDVLEKNYAFLVPRIEEGGYTIERRIQGNLPQIVADPNMLYQVFLNILINAMQAMPEGGTVTVEMSADTDTVFLAFEDEGNGIDEEVMRKIWNPFFTTKEMGTGLGLSVVKNIVEAHNGSIRLENGPVRGARVLITLPIGGGNGDHTHR